jgi:thiamine biosynthesis protein ThiS
VITITVNGETRDLEEPLTIHDFLLTLQLKPEITIVEQNGTIIDKSLFAETRVSDGDTLELIRFMGGGA